MSCRRAFDIDLADFLSEPGREEFADFREHYPLCPDCAAEVRAWTDLHVLLQSRMAGPNGGHPDPEMLLRYEQSDARLAASAVEEIESHLARCPSCRDELSALRQFDFSALGAEVPRGATVRDRLAAFLGGLRGLFAHPAFAYALVLLLLYPAAMSFFSDTETPELFPTEAASEMRLAQKPAPPEEAEPKKAARSQPSSPPETRANVLRKYQAPRAPEPTPQRARAKVERSRGGVAVSEAPVLDVAPSEAAVREGKRDAAELAASEVLEYEEAPAPTQIGVAGEAASDRPAADVYGGPEPGRWRASAMSRRVGGDPPPWILRVPVPDDVRRAPQFEVRLTHPDGRRELRQRFVSSEVGEEVEISLPLDWRLIDENRVEFHAISD
jgi:hypothetical protein